MEFNGVEFSGFRPFVGSCSLNFDSLPGRIVSLDGANGSGKTRFLELLRGAIYRTMPTRGKVIALAADRKSVLSVTITTDQRYTLKQIIDAHTGKAEAVVMDAAGLPLTDSGKLTEFDAWVAEHLPDADLLSATSFAPQGEKGFFGLSKADRKSVMLRALRIEHYETLAEAARDKLRAAKDRLETTLARFNELSEHVLGIDAARAAVEAARQESASATEALKQARTALAEVNGRAQAVDKENEANRQLRLQAAALDTRIASYEQRLTMLDSRMQAAQVVLARRLEIDAAVARVAEIDAALTAGQESLEAKRAEIATAQTALATVAADRRSCSQRESTASTKAFSLRLRLKERESVEQAAKVLPDLEAILAQCEADTKAAFEALRDLQGTALVDADEARGKLRVGLSSVRDTADGWHNDDAAAAAGRIDMMKSIAVDTLKTDDDAFAHAKALPDRLREASELEREKDRVAMEARGEVEQCRRIAARLTEIEQAAGDLIEQEKIIEASTVDLARLDAAFEAAENTVKALRADLQTLETARTALSTEKQGLNDTAALQVQLEQAQARSEELAKQHDEAVAEAAAVSKERDLIKIPTDPEAVDTRTEELDVSYAESAAQRAGTELGTAEAALLSAAKIADRLRILDVDRRAFELEVADYTRLAFELGRDGLQALEIDAAGPELTELTNDLLHSCFGSRFTVQIETTKPTADGKKEKEVFDGIVYDSQEGPKTFDQLSGGQAVIVGEAVSLALTMIACRRSGVLHPTLVRDETGAALDGENGVAYVAMLRRAADIVGASKVIFVTHNPELQVLADHQLYIYKGMFCANKAEYDAAMSVNARIETSLTSSNHG